VRGLGPLAALLVVPVSVVVLVRPGVLPGVPAGTRGYLPWSAGTCRSTVLDVVVAPAVEVAVSQVVAAAEGSRLPDGTCLHVRLRAQAPADTVSGSAVLPQGSAPHLWVADSSLWVGQVRAWSLRRAGSFGSTPVVLVSGAAAVAAAGWSSAGAAPSWRTALDGSVPLQPQLSRTSAGLLALGTLWQVSGGGAAADRQVTAALLAVDRGAGISEEVALSGVGRGRRGQALVVSTEQAVLAVTRDEPAADLVAVYPREGSPVLDFPVVRIAPERLTAARRAAADVVVAALTGPSGHAAARRAGLRDSSGGGSPSRGAAAVVRPPAAPQPAGQESFLARVASLPPRSRVLVVVDVSPSMRAEVPGTGLSRLTLAGRAAAVMDDVLPDSSSVGLWVFALNLDGRRPYRQLVPVAPLGGVDGTDTHRQALSRQLRSLGRRVSRDGTGLYETALAAVRAARAGYDPRAVNSVVLLTDGADASRAGLSLEQLVEALRRDDAAEPTRPVRLVAVDVGSRARLPALRAMAEPTGGAAYRLEGPSQLRRVLIDVVSRSVTPTVPTAR
jgi:hypothetical protein